MAVLAPAPTATSEAWYAGRPQIRWTRFMPHAPHPKQHAFLWLPQDDALYGGAAGGGKSDALLLAALQYVDVPNYAAMLFRRTYEDLSLPGALIPRSKEWLYPLLGERAWNEQRSRWTFPSGATLGFGYLRNEDDHFRYQGMEVQFIGVDEAGQIRPNQLRYLHSRLRRLEGSGVPIRMRLASNPGGQAHDYLKTRYIDRQPDPDDPEDTWEKARSRIFVPARLRDNPSLDIEQYEQSLSHLEPEVRAQLLDGDWDAREPGDWYFDDLHVRAVVEQGRRYEQALQDDAMVVPSGGVLHLGIDWGESTHCLLGWPLEHGGMFIAREYVDYGGEPSEKTVHMIGLSEWDLPWGRAFFDAAGVQSQKTFNLTATRLFGHDRPSAKAVPFGAKAPTTAKAARSSYKGVAATYLRRLARRAHGIHVKQRTDKAGRAVTLEVDARDPEGVFVPGPLPGHLAISPRCPVLIRQLKQLERNPEDPTGAWLKDDDQHGPDAGIALVAHMAVRFRAADTQTAKAAA